MANTGTLDQPARFCQAYTLFGARTCARGSH